MLLGLRFHEGINDTEGVRLLRCRCMRQIPLQMLSLLGQASSSFYSLVTEIFVLCPVKHHAHALHPVLACWDSGGWEVQGVGACVVLVGGNARRRFRCNSDR